MSKKVKGISFIVLIVFIISLAGCNENVNNQPELDGQPVLDDQPASDEEVPKYPDGPIEIIVGFGAGGGTDTMARLIQPKLQEILGVPVVVQNMPGAQATIAVEHVYRQPSDGQTILFQADTVRAYPTMGMTDLNYKDFEQIGIGALGIANFVVLED
ncbi:MAG: tripartite tricarboxylate transporter substrate-binding protein, partial [Dysgonamonadaceae bacterium]|nr:tripartite tricarboxylate transporter substrate-binding protein [Dysgonamonadaceae bacterium]